MPLRVQPAGITILIGLGVQVIAMAGTWVKSWADDPEKKRRCSEEWQQAHEICAERMRVGAPKRGMTGGYLNPYDCARGLVSEECGGNRVDYGEKK